MTTFLWILGAILLIVAITASIRRYKRISKLYLRLVDQGIPHEDAHQIIESVTKTVGVMTCSDIVIMRPEGEDEVRIIVEVD